MAFWKVITLAFTSFFIVDAKVLVHQNTTASSSICDPAYNNTNRVQCYCVHDKKDPTTIGNADCYLTQQNVTDDDIAWSAFKHLKTVRRINFLYTRVVSLTYVPTEAIKELKGLKKLEIKYGIINVIGAYAFANLSSLEEITLRDNQIRVLDPYAFINHRDLKIINLDTNNIVEINRNVFVELPSLEKLYLTNNQISTIHDRAFIHLTNLRELEIDRNKVFSLNFAVFEGLKNLERLDLSSNSLEVIGDDTFQALENLKSLNLDGNNIQMLDDKAFNGLGKLQSLSLAHNKLVEIDSDKVFEGLDSLISLSLKANQIKELKHTVMAPILKNFYGNISSLDVEDNNFPCNCQLEWFISLMNKTQNKDLKRTIDNLKCMPDANLREAWTKSEKSATQVVEEEETQGNEYEYYDDTQLNGKLFYVDIRDLLNCSKSLITVSEAKATTTTLTKDTSPTTTVTNELNVSKVTTTTVNTPIDLTSATENVVYKSEKNKRDKNDYGNQETFTTTRLATVSAKPLEAKIYENMASDEAKPDKNNGHSIQEAPGKISKRVEEEPISNNGNKKGCAVSLVLMVLCSRLQV